MSVADYIENVGQHIESIVYLAYSMADEFVKVNKSQNKNNKSKNKIQTKNNIKTVKYMLVFVDLKSCLRYNETI